MRAAPRFPCSLRGRGGIGSVQLFATEVAVDAHSVVPAPDSFSITEAACLLVAARTAHHALVDRAQWAPQEMAERRAIGRIALLCGDPRPFEALH
jgi:NADPH:quinone reductase-like Zn-dependent oxidoreductase